MRVVAAGASGVVGIRLVRQLIDAGHGVIGTLRGPGGAGCHRGRRHRAALRRFYGADNDGLVEPVRGPESPIECPVRPVIAG
jgi:nucleoside-diphosphate-sugar epimerase